MEKIIEERSCNGCQCKFHITDKDLEFYEKISPVFGGKKYQIPTPSLCPECRQKRRLIWRNERSIYKRVCDFSGKEIISMYQPNTPYKVYHYSHWWRDDWNPMDYGNDFDHNKSFLGQFHDLSLQVPHPSTEVNIIENSEYSNCVGMLENCYLLFASGSNKNCLYGDNLERSEDCVDSTFIYDCRECYNVCTLHNCYKVYHSFNCRDCNYSQYLTFCNGCNNCFACVNLNNQEYSILNKKYSPDEYTKILANDDQIKKILKEYEILKKSSIKKYYTGHNVTNSTGDYLYNCENLINSHITENSKDSKHITFCRKTQDCMDFDFFGDPGSLCYESITCGYPSVKCLFSISCINDVSNLFYCLSCYGSSDCFGCVGLKNKQYCILNKQYTKEEYEKLVPKIIEKMEQDGEWGEFFPSSMSPFGYNETVANEYFPLTKQEALDKGFNWSDYEAPFPKVEKIIPADKLPNKIEDIPNDILNWAIECEVTKKPFRIIKSELEFYRKHDLPIPKRHPDQRHLDRMSLRNPRKLYERQCDKCEKNIQTTYSPKRKETVYCESCYNKEIY